MSKPQLILPVPSTIPISATFGQPGRHWEPKDPATGLGKHHGVDFACPMGTTVRAMSGGVVKEVTSTVLGGLFVWVEHRRKEYAVTVKGMARYPGSSYHHLSEPLVKVGQEVTQGEPVARSGNSGSNTTGEHLHVTLRDARGAAIDPMPLLVATPYVDIGPESGWEFATAKWAKTRLNLAGIDGELRPEEPVAMIRFLEFLRRALKE